jgi:osmotically-inducible protein OsmY
MRKMPLAGLTAVAALLVAANLWAYVIDVEPPPSALNAGITRAANNALQGDPAIRRFPITVRHADGVLWVEGEAPDRRTASRALQLAQSVSAGTEVRSSLSINPRLDF